jgi:hypothetical protein
MFLPHRVFENRSVWEVNQFELKLEPLGAGSPPLVSAVFGCVNMLVCTQLCTER